MNILEQYDSIRSQNDYSNEDLRDMIDIADIMYLTLKELNDRVEGTYHIFKESGE